MDWYTILIIAHIVGVALGVGGATFAEVNLVYAKRDGEISPDENALMQSTYAVLRLGFFLLVLSGFGFLLYYRLSGAEELLYSSALWAKFAVIGILSASAVLMQLRLIPLLWGSAVSITSWYAALVLGVFARGDVNSSYVTILSIYALAVVTMYYILQLIHKKFVPHKEH